MKLIEQYIFKKVGWGFLLTLVTLSATVWLTQALRQFDLVSAMGQTIGTFFEVTLLLLPALATLVSPIAVLIAVIYAFRQLNDGSELVVINASGSRQSALLRPVLLLGVLVAVFMSTMTLYFSPLSLRLWRALLTDVRGSVVTSFLQEGEFLNIAAGLTFHLRHRKQDGTLEGIFLSDTREPDQSVTYLAKRGVVIDNPVGVFLAMNDGTIQRRSKADGSISIIEFSSYAFDLSTLASRAPVPPYKPIEQPTTYLVNPDSGDGYFQHFPGKFRAELHYRLTAPLNAILFAVLPLVFLGQAETTRQQRSATTVLAVCAAVGLGVTEYVLNSLSEDFWPAIIGMYALPLGVIGLCIALVLTGRQPRPPERLVAVGDLLTGRVSGLFRRSPAPAGRRSG
jgi:lipopolysaccharide export system permease protein